MGLEDDQEAYILHRIESAIEETNHRLDASGTLYHAFNGILTTMKEVTAKQQQLQETFAEMNTVHVSDEPIDDGSIEML